MRTRLKRDEMTMDQIIAIGLVWGHLRARQFEEAFLLAKGCLLVWPEERNLILMHAYAAAEVLEPVDTERLLAARTAACDAWITMVLRRAGMAPKGQP
ncbi:hypothetical protein [Pseudoduganella namucuonensis]|uniref:Uncharacterized protein n=1 Tax=Pseudoduganella namucuonensis TaxID=1035707 RepID=A0A1I7LW53_9BURK|nr:hypothetical protein [Pseudoduganella namucuonensis]SFV13902.1 hypothetical protein SAMN05216552_104038 [Pseudoduganella namucuonensis]